MDQLSHLPYQPPPSNIDAWLRICKNVLWFHHQPYENYHRGRLHLCSSISELAAQLQKKDCPIGEAFYYENVCFVNVVDSANEWVVLKDAAFFTSFPVRKYIEAGQFAEFIECLQDDWLTRLRKFLQ